MKILIEKSILEELDLFHGTSHEFDCFSLSKIGTGEGNQSFGWGLYFTDNKNIAEYYANSVAAMKKTLWFEGKLLAENPNIKNLSDYLEPKINYLLNLQVPFNVLYDNIIEIYKNLYFQIKNLKKDQKYSFQKEKLNKLLLIDKEFQYFIKNKPKIEYKAAKKILYTVKLHGDKNPKDYDYLLWDNYVTKKQNSKIKNLTKKNKKYSFITEDFMTLYGQQLYYSMK